MFEGIVASILNKYLSEYIDEVDYNNLKLGIFSGTIELLNVKIKPTSLYQFDLPILVKRGIIGKLKINISWKNIMTKPAVAIVEDLFVLLGPFEDKINDPKRVEEIFAAHKRKRLQELEKIDKAQLFESKEKGFAEKLQDTIINNIQIYIKNVHIRYEDKHSLPNRNVSFGIFIKEFKAETVDAFGKPNFLNADEKVIYKNGSLKGFNLYWNISDNKDSLITMQPNFKTEKDKWIQHLKESIDTGQILNVPFDTFIEKNLDLEIRLTLRRSYQKEDFYMPKITIQSTVSATEFVFQRHQYKTILEIIDYYSMLNLHKKYVKYRPLEGKERNNKEWWNYAFTALAETTWRSYRKERMIQHFKNYKIYLDLYKQKLTAEKTNKQFKDKDMKKLEELEKTLNIDSILDARNLLREEIYPTEKPSDLAVTLETNERPKSYVEFKLIINLTLISIKLKNAGFDILQINFKNIISRFEIKPNADSYYFLLNTRGIDILGIYYEGTFKNGKNHQLVPIVKSRVNTEDIEVDENNDMSQVTLLATEDANDFLFTFCFETNPLNIQGVEFSIRTRVSSLEISYEKTTITELLRFFRTDLIDFEEVKKIREVWSRAGLIYAVENHKQFHIKAELSSPYFIIPVKGTCLQECDSIVFFLGKTIIQSEVQAKTFNYTATDIHDLEKNFYDKLTLSVNDVQVALMPSNVNWRNYLENCNITGNYRYHLLYPVTTTNEVFISINPNYKKLPKLKLNASCSSIKLNFSDEKIIKLADFAQKFPKPDIPKSYQSATQSHTIIQNNPTNITKKSKDVTDSNNKPTKKNKKDVIKMTEKFEVEPDDEWDGPFNLPININGDPIVNYCQLVFKFIISDFSIDLKATLNEEEIEYLKLIFHEIKIDFAITKFGMHFRAGLGDLKLIDQIHKSDLNEYTEILSSSSRANYTNQIIKFYFRQVEPEASNFATLYHKILTNILFDCSNIHLVCHRTAIIYFIKYAKSIVDNITVNNKGDIDNLDSEPNNKDKSKQLQPHQPSFSNQVSIVNTPTHKKSSTILDVCDFNLIAKMNELTWKMFDTNFSFGNLTASEFSLNYNMCGIKTDLRIQLNTIIINYDDDFNTKLSKENILSDQEHHLNKFYKQIITCSGDSETKKFFDFNLILFDTDNKDENKNSNNKDCIKLTVGKIKVILLVKFVNELIDFIDPIITPLTEQVKEQAIEAVNIVKNAYQETKSEGKRIYLLVHVTSPQLIVPQNSTSFSAFLINLGNLSISNRFIEIPVSSQDKLEVVDSKKTPYNVIDEINLMLQNVEIRRIAFDKNNVNIFYIREQVFEPINLVSKVKRTLTNLEEDVLPDLEISVSLKDLKCMISLKSAKLLFAILDENLNEGLNNKNGEKPTISTSTESQSSKKTSKNKPESNIRSENEQALITSTNEKDRVTMKIHVDVNKIKLIVVELKKIKENSLQRVKDDSISTILDSSKYQSTQNTIYSQVNFSQLEIDEILFNFIQNKFDSWSLDLKLRDLNLTDLRPDSNLAVKEMFIPIMRKSYFFKMIFNSNQITESNLEFEVDHIKVNLCLPYILKLYQMVMEAVSNQPKAVDANINSADSNVGASSEVSKLSKKKPDQTKPQQQNQEEQENDEIEKKVSAPLKVIGKINLPEIVLFAEPEKQDSKILVMNVLLELNFKSENEQTNLEIYIADLSLRLGEFPNYKRQGIIFLHPCSALISMTQNNPKSPALYKTSIDSLYFNMTPTLYETVMGVINTINRSGTEKLKEETTKKKLLEDSEPFIKYQVEINKKKDGDEISEYEAKNYDNLSTANDHEERNNSNTSSSLTGGVQAVLEALDLAINEAFITFCEETGVDLQPLAIVKLELNGRVSNWTKNLHTKADLSIEASYYNDRLSNWEPLIENVMQNEDNYRPWLLNLWFAMEPGCILQPPVENERIDLIDFPVKDLDYSKLDNTEDENKDEEKSLILSTQKSFNQKSSRFHHSTNIDDYYARTQMESMYLNTSVMKQERDDQKIASFIMIESNDVLNLNVTPSAYKVIMYLAQITAGSIKKEILENKVKPPLKFLNFLGEKCDLLLASGSHLQPDHAVGFNLLTNEPQFIPQTPRINSNRIISSNRISTITTTSPSSAYSKERIQKIVNDSQHSQIDTVYNENYKFTIHVNGFEKCKLSMKNDGSFLFKLKEESVLHYSPSTMSPLSPDGSIYSNGGDQVIAKPKYETVKRDMMYKVKTLYGRTKIIFSSPLQIENYCQIRLLIMVEIDEQKNPEIKSKLNIIKEIKINDTNDQKTYGVIFKLLPSKVFYVPLYAAYNCKLYATPDNDMYMPALIFDIRGYNLKIDVIKEVTCKRLNIKSNQNKSQLPLLSNDFQFIRHSIINVRKHQQIMPTMSANRRISLYSPVKIYNSLPLSIRIDIDDESSYSTLIKPGENLNIHLSLSKLDNCRVHVINYLGINWQASIDWTKFSNQQPKTVKLDMILTPTNELSVSDKHLSVYLNFKLPNVFTLYCPYWLVNKSGQQIKLRSSDTQRKFEIPDDSILLFDYKKESKNNKVTMSVNGGKWSNLFSLETAGTTGMIQCSDSMRTYNFLLRITMSNSSRTKLITFAPFLTIANQLDDDILIREWHRNERRNEMKGIMNHYNWKTIEPIRDASKPVAFWPNFAGESKQVSFVIRLGDYETQPFPLENPGRFVLIAKEKQRKQDINQNLVLQNNDSLAMNNTTEVQKIITVLISGGSQNPVTIVVRKYQYGDSVAKFINLCDDLNIFIKQKNSDGNWKLEPYKSMFFIWPELIKSTRELQWTVDNSTRMNETFGNYEPLRLTKSGKDTRTFYIQQNDLSTQNMDENHDLVPGKESDKKDLMGKFYADNSTSSKPVIVSCVSYIDDTQRIILFTKDESLADVERSKECSSMEIFVALKGLQVSVINNVNLEIASIAIRDSKPVWELNTINEIKTFTSEYCEWLEKQYKNYILSMSSNKTLNTTTNASTKKRNQIYRDIKFEIDFKNMMIYKPEGGRLKRKWYPGLSLQYRTSINMMSLKSCVYKLQIDNQLPDAYFPICFYKAPDITKETTEMLTFSLFTEQQEVTKIYRHLELILQEFYLKVDKGFLFSVKDWYDAAIETTKIEENFELSENEFAEPDNLLLIVDQDNTSIDKIDRDIKLTKEIMEYANQQGDVKQSAHIRFDDFYLSPIMFNLSFSVQGTEHTDDAKIAPTTSNNIYNFFLESIGATITEFKDVKFKFGLFNLNNQTKTWKELYDELFDHYKIQVLHQAYVLILGLDVLGNPFGLVSDFSQGLTDLFYDPLLGYFSKSGELEKIEFNMRNRINSTVIKTISSAAGSGSLIAGSIGRVLATCTFDKEYKRKRQYKLSKSSTMTFQDTMTIAGKGIVSGLVYGLSGVVRKPVEESKNGTKGVFKGLGKGCIGLFTKPIGSIFDGISQTLDGLKRFSQSGSEQIMNFRLPRYLLNEVAILPYSEYQAKGYEILRDLQNDDIALDESYWAHIFIDTKMKVKNSRFLLFITDRHILKLRKTHTQILKKWKLIEKAIHFQKISGTQISHISEREENSLVPASLFRRKTNVLIQQLGTSNVNVENNKDSPFYDLYLLCNDIKTNDQEVEKKLLLFSELKIINWINDKINSAIKYHKESNNVY